MAYGMVTVEDTDALLETEIGPSRSWLPILGQCIRQCWAHTGIQYVFYDPFVGFKHAIGEMNQGSRIAILFQPEVGCYKNRHVLQYT